MRVKIHRGAHEIGGSCVEVESAGKRLVLDVGKPLGTEREAVVPLPGVEGFIDTDPNLLGVLITHAHQDHWGLAEQLPAGVPLFMGRATADILREAARWSTGLTRDTAGYLQHRVPFELGPFTVTPFLNDHSAFDAYSLFVQADGRGLFYTGDIRGHGRTKGIFRQLLRVPPRPVDVLLMEGTNVQSLVDEEDNSADFSDPVTETELERIATQTMRTTKGMVFLSFSAQNIDRLVTFYRAAKRSGRTLVIDLYTARIALATGNVNIPRPGPDWPNVKVYVPRSQRVQVLKSQEFDLVDDVKPYRIFEEQLAASPEKFAVKFSLQTGRALASHDCLAGSVLVWSLWSGYLKEDSGYIHAFLEKHGIPLRHCHTSGHASVKDLQRLAKALQPGRIVPIHTFAGHRFTALFDKVSEASDGEWWEV